MNGVPVTGSAVFGEAFRGAHPGDTLRVEVQSSGEAKRVVNIRLTRAVRPNPFTSTSSFFDFLLLIALPAFALALGFWVTAARPRDGRAWLLLALLPVSQRSSILAWIFGALSCAIMARFTKTFLRDASPFGCSYSGSIFRNRFRPARDGAVSIGANGF